MTSQSAEDEITNICGQEKKFLRIVFGFRIQISFSKFQLSTMSDSSLLSSEASLSSSDLLDSFSNFDKLKPYDFEPTVSDNENADREVSSSAMQTKEAEKKRKGNLDWCLCGKFKAMSTNAESLCRREKNEVSDEILNGNFLHF